MKTRYYIDPATEVRVVVRSSDDVCMADTVKLLNKISSHLIRVDFFGYWLAKFGMMKLALKFKVN